MPTPLEVNSPAYKKALRLHKKSKKTPAAEDIPALREQEKEYKAKFPPPSLAGALDLSWNSELHGDAWRGSATVDGLRGVLCRHSAVKAFGIESIPGFVLLPGFLSIEEQRHLIQEALENHARHPNENNLDTHYILPKDGLWNAWKEYCTREREGNTNSPPIIATKGADDTDGIAESRRTLINNTAASVENFEEMRSMPKVPPPPSTTLSPLPLNSILHKLRWSNIGHFYHWGTKSYEFDRPYIPVPADIKRVCTNAVQAVDWSDVWKEDQDIIAEEWENSRPDWDTWPETFAPEAGIINFYQLKDTLMAHVDRSEMSSTSPLVSISLGQAAVFLIGGLTREERATPIILRSGDVLIMSGPRCRRAFHGVPRILEGSLPAYLKRERSDSEDWGLIADYLETTRININVRQVFPPNFPYEKHGLEFLRPNKGV
ncbi:hypothetical protein CPB86DRAFT_722448 [Serendipita vermifera]|nr:hypothetical protein CPB86DRAFT_722448 [Serendipita vermifera]